MLTDQIWGWCKDWKSDPVADGEAGPDPKHLPCTAVVDEFAWDELQKLPAY
jgi:hypothetical protein